MLANPNSLPISSGERLPCSALQTRINREMKAKNIDFSSFDIAYQLNVAQCVTFRASDHENCLSINSSAVGCRYILDDFIFKIRQIDNQINTTGGRRVKLVGARNTYMIVPCFCPFCIVKNLQRTKLFYYWKQCLGWIAHWKGWKNYQSWSIEVNYE